MRTVHRKLTLLVVVVLLSTGCSPKVPLEVTVRQPAVDVLYGSPDEPLVDRPSGAAIGGSSAPGLIAAPVRFEPAADGDTRRSPAAAPETTSRRREPSCVTAPPDAAPTEVAPISVAAPPVPGVYAFRRSGTVKATQPGGSDDDLEALNGRPLPTLVRRRVSNVVTTPTSAGPYITYDVIETQEGDTLTTTTSYEIDPAGSGGVTADTTSDPGVRIARIMVQGKGTDGIEVNESFNPQPHLKILDLPLRVQAAQANRLQQSTRGTDPLTGASMEVFRQTLPRKRVDVCGKIVDAWRIKIGDPSDPSRQSTFSAANGRAYAFYGEIAFAPQLALIIADDFVFGGPGRLNLERGGRRFSQTSAATLNDVNPR